MKFDIDEHVFIQCQESYDILEGTIITPPTSKSNFYTVRMNDGEEMNFETKDIYTEHTVPASETPSHQLGFFAPAWLKQDQKVTLLHRDVYRRGYLSIGTENLWEFVVRDRDGKDIVSVPIADIAYSWKNRIQENTFELGW